MRRDSTPSRGYSGRRSSHGGYYGGSKGEMGNIWEVVSALANALQDARNQLVSLMHTSKSGPLRTLSPLRSPLRLSGGQRCIDHECCYSRAGTPSRSAARNLHRAHAHGRVAFGVSAEYPVTPRRSREVHARMSAQQASSPPAPAGRRCTHPLHGIGPEARNYLPARRVHPSWPSGVVKGCRKSHGDDQPAPRVDRACVNFSAGKEQGGSSAGSRHDSSPDPQRKQHHSCMAKQFASLLSHEAHQQRERRLAEEMLRDKRPSWSRF